MTADAAELDRDFLRQCPRAYIVSDSCEERSTVVYARNPMEARRLGHYQDDVGAMDYEECLTVRRAPELDDLGGKSLLQAQLDTGWWFTCAFCEARVSYDEWRYDPNDEEREFEIEPTIHKGEVYCSPWCAGANAARHVERRAMAWGALEWAVTNFPGCRILSVMTCGVDHQNQRVPRVNLTLPPDHEWRLTVQRSSEPEAEQTTSPQWEAYHEQLGRQPPPEAVPLWVRRNGQ